MTLIRRTGSFLALALSLACSSDSILLPRQGLRFSFAQNQCGPADGPAVAIFLTRDPTDGPTPVAPYARIYIDLSGTTLDGRAHSVAPDSRDAFATFNRTADDYEIASSGSVVATYSSGDNTISGLADIVFTGAGHLVSGFRAPVFPLAALCP